MPLLASANYDPAVRVLTSTSLRAMTALDTTNLRLTFTVPANGNVLVRLRTNAVASASVYPSLLLGVLEGSTVRMRQAPIGENFGAQIVTQEALGVVTGLTAGSSLTWDAAYGSEIAGGNTFWGGPDNATGSNASGGFVFEVYDTPNLLGAVSYDPAVAVSKSTATLTAMTAFDTTNLRITFTVPTSGKVLVRIRCCDSGSAGAAPPMVLLGVMEGATVRGRQLPIMALPGTASTATSRFAFEASFIVSGLTAGASLSWDAAYAVQVVMATSNIQYGGPNDTTTNNAWGAFGYEVWAV